MPKVCERGKLADRLRMGLACALVGLVVFVLAATPLGAQLWALLNDPSVERVRHVFDASPAWLPLVIIGLMVLHTFVPVPAEILALAAGMALGQLWGFVTIWVGAMLGAYLGFFLIRTFGQPLLLRLVAPQRLERAQGWLGQVDIPILLAVRMVPVFSFNLINFVLGLTEVTGWRFIWTTGVGIVPLTAFMVVFGAHLHDWRVLALMTLAALLIGWGGYVILRRRYPYQAGLPWRAAHQPEQPDGHRS